MADPNNKPNKNNGSAPKRTSQPRIVTMDQIRNSGQESERQAYFAGGSETSGQQILGGRGRRNEDSSHSRESSEALAAAFRRAAAGSESHDPPGAVARQPESRLFVGVGHRLGDTETPNEDPDVASQPAQDPENPARVVLTLWENGYTLDNGPILSYDDPRCAELMANIDRGELPTEFLPYGRPGPVHLAVIDKRAQKYKESVKVFGGKGHKLGSPTPPVSATQDETASEVTPMEIADEEVPSGAGQDSSSGNRSGNDSFKNSVDSLVVMRKRRAKPLTYEEDNDVIFEDEDNSSASDDVVFVSSETRVEDLAFQGYGQVLDRPSTVAQNSTIQPEACTELLGDNFDMSDEGAKTTTIKIRLPGGKSVQMIVNASNTVQELREFIRLCIPFLSEATFSLQLSYPKRELEDDETCDSKDINNSLLTVCM